MRLSETQVEAACQWWRERLEATRDDPVPFPPEKIDAFCGALGRLLSGEEDTPFGRLVARVLDEETEDIMLVSERVPKGVLAEAALTAGFVREFVIFPPNIRMRFPSGGVLVEAPGVPAAFMPG